MTTTPRVFWLHTLTPLGAAPGPVAEDPISRLPIVSAAAIRRAWSAHLDSASAGRGTAGRAPREAAAGGADARATGAAEAAGPGDARLVCHPIRRGDGAEAWCASPGALQLLHADLARAKLPDLPSAPPALPPEHAHRTTTTVLEQEGRVHLAGHAFTGHACGVATAWSRLLASAVFPDVADQPRRDHFIAHFAVIPDATFATMRLAYHADEPDLELASTWLAAGAILVGLQEEAADDPRFRRSVPTSFTLDFGDAARARCLVAPSR